MRLIKGIWLLILLGWLVPMPGQNSSLPVYYYPYRHYTPLDGLSQQQTVSIYQDRHGYIWVGTKIGENRFDGTTFSNYTTSKGYSDDHILGFFEDRQGVLWSYGLGGIYSHVGDSLITHLPKDFKDDYGPNSLVVGWQEKLFFSNRTVPDNLYSLSDGKVMHIPLKWDLANEVRLTNLAFDRENEILYADAYDDTTQTHYLLSIDAAYNTKVLKSTPKGVLNFRLLSSKKSGVYFVLQEILYKVEKDNLRIIEYLPKEMDVVKDIEIRSSGMVIGTQSQLWKKEGDTWIDMGISLNGPYALLVDKENRIWTPTEEGLIKITSEAFRIYPQSRGMIRYAWNVLEDRSGRLWFASHGSGITSLKDKQYGLTNNIIAGRGHDYLYMGGTKLKDGSLLFPASFGALHYDVQTGFRYFPGSGGAGVLFIWQDPENDVIFIGSNTLRVIHPNGDTMVYADEQGLPMERLRFITNIVKDKEGVIWLSSRKGLAKYFNKKFDVHFVGEGPVKPIYTSCKDYKGNIWFGSSRGLYLYDYTTELPTYVGGNVFDGFIAFIKELDDKHLLVGVTNGLYVIDLQEYYASRKLAYDFIGVESGFDGISPVMNGAFQSGAGNYWICTASNVLEFMPSKYKEEERKIALKFSSVSYREKKNKDISIKINIKENEPIRLFTEYRKIKIDYHAIDFENPTQAEFRYRLLGYDTLWSMAGQNRSAEFTSLPEGKFTFQLRCSINGVDVAQEDLPIVVNASSMNDYKLIEENAALLIFITLAIIGIGFAGMMFYMYRKKKKEEAERLKMQIANLSLKQRITEGQINPHFIFNILNALQTTVMKGDNERAEKYLNRFSKVFYPILRNDGLLTCTLEKELEITENYLALEKIRWPNKFEYTIVKDEYVDPFIRVPKMLIQTFANNAIKHGLEPKRRDGRLFIQVSRNDVGTRIIVEDNGVGRIVAAKKESFEPSGNGIMLIEELLALLDQSSGNHEKSFVQILDLTDEEGSPSGTRVVVWINNNFKTE